MPVCTLSSHWDAQTFFSGHLRVVFDFGFERQELVYPNKYFGLGQYHDLRMRRRNSGQIFIMEVNAK
jgi:hypothetical protein